MKGLPEYLSAQTNIEARHDKLKIPGLSKVQKEVKTDYKDTHLMKVAIGLAL